MRALMRHDSAMIGQQRCLVAGEDCRQVAGHAIEERGARDHAVFDDLVQPGAELAARKRREHVRIDCHRGGRWNAPIRFLPSAWLTPTLPPIGAVHLRQQRRRHLHHRHAAQVRRGGEASDVADDAAADRDERGRAVGARHGSAHRRCARPCRGACSARRRESGSGARRSGRAKRAAVQAPDRAGSRR